jgi:hypothetical protein
LSEIRISEPSLIMVAAKFWPFAQSNIRFKNMGFSIVDQFLNFVSKTFVTG